MEAMDKDMLENKLEAKRRQVAAERDSVMTPEKWETEKERIKARREVAEFALAKARKKVEYNEQEIVKCDELLAGEMPEPDTLRLRLLEDNLKNMEELVVKIGKIRDLKEDAKTTQERKIFEEWEQEAIAEFKKAKGPRI